MEREKRRLGKQRSLIDLAADMSAERSSPSRSATEQSQSSAHQRKRPNVSAAERKWRDKTWKQCPTPSRAKPPGIVKSGNTIDTPSDTWDTESTQLASQLQDFVLEEMNKAQRSLDSSKIKYQPKPVLRYKDRHPEPVDAEHTMSMDDDDDDDNDFVYDTYIRESKPADASTLVGTFGLLVLESEKDTQAFLVDAEEDSDVEFDTDDEDENGMETVYTYGSF
jgi:hypothetical protein